MLNLQNCVGYKLFKDLGDSIELIRIIKVRKYKDGGNPAEITIRDEGTGEIKKVRVDSLEGFTPLEPDGYLTFNVVMIRDAMGKPNKDVVVTASKFLNMKIGDNMPFAVCRQSCTDIFHTLVTQSTELNMVGLSVNRNTCPTNFDFRIMLACDDIVYSDHVNIYRTDLVMDILDMIKLNKFDEVMKDLFMEHVKHTNNPALMFKNEHDGWCKDLKKLLEQNNFQTDVDEMLSMTALDFELDRYLVEKDLPGHPGEKFTSCTEELKEWLSYIFHTNIDDITLIEYGHDINLAEFNNSKYFLLRDNTNKIYLTVYTSSGEFLAADLEASANQKDFSTEFRLNFYNKYNKDK